MMFIPSMYCFVFMYMCSFMMVMSSEDWFLVWIGLEVNMISFLVMIYRRYSIMNIECCLKYFFVQSMGSALLIGMFYYNLYIISGMLILVLSYKVGAGPYFYWFPSLCSGLDWLSCYMLMMFQKILPILLMTLFIHWVVWMIIMISLIVGVFGSFNQSNIKELMAYSSIHHLGWILIIMLNKNLSWILYLFVYGMVLLGVMGTLISEEIVNLFKMNSCKGKFVFMMNMLSMAGIPPLLGFFLKWMALINIMNVNMLYLMILIIVSVIMLYVYIRIVYDVYMGGSVVWSLNDHMNKYNYNMEMFSMVGLIIGIFFMIYMIM